MDLALEEKTVANRSVKHWLKARMGPRAQDEAQCDELLVQAHRMALHGPQQLLEMGSQA